ncbi:hypothetical protein Patl1_37441 [Pistacia atlantica]|nr:hypothetical protein Patl1_37441 [Pistacia atlantica]
MIIDTTEVQDINSFSRLESLKEVYGIICMLVPILTPVLGITIGSNPSGQSLMNSFSNHYWNLASRKNSLKQVEMRQGHFFPNGSGKAYLSSALDLCLGSLIETSHT